jgi:hypothetical protein
LEGTFYKTFIKDSISIELISKINSIKNELKFKKERIQKNLTILNNKEN